MIITCLCDGSWDSEPVDCAYDIPSTMVGTTKGESTSVALHTAQSARESTLPKALESTTTASIAAPQAVQTIVPRTRQIRSKTTAASSKSVHCEVPCKTFETCVVASNGGKQFFTKLSQRGNVN